MRNKALAHSVNIEQQLLCTFKQIISTFFSFILTKYFQRVYYINKSFCMT
jgi:hypothetical protein